MIQAAGHHGAVAQHPELIPQAVAEALSPALPGGQLRPVKTLAVFQKDALRQPEALPHRLPFPRKRPVQLHGHGLVEGVAAGGVTIQVPKAQDGDLSGGGRLPCKGGAVRKVIRKGPAVIGLQTMQGDADLADGGGGKEGLAALRQQGAVGGDVDRKIQPGGDGKKLRQVGVQQRLAHQVEVEVPGGGAQPFCQKAKFRRGQHPGRAPGAGAKAAPQIAAVGDLEVDFFVLAHSVPPTW